jgi:hypothetical protein
VSTPHLLKRSRSSFSEAVPSKLATKSVLHGGAVKPAGRSDGAGCHNEQEREKPSMSSNKKLTVDSPIRELELA